jgi:alkylation response protein AidB-like acyl-CoA dehydrogenase
MDFELSRENLMIRDAAHDWVRKECTREVVAEYDESDEFPKKLLKKFSKLGFSGMCIPEEYGGEGRNIPGACIVSEEIAYMFPALASCYASSAFHGGSLIAELGSENQKQQYLPDFAKGKKLASIAVNESEDGPDLSKIQTMAVREGSGYILNGEKRYISHAEQADLFLVLAKTGKVPGKDRDLTFFCVDSGSSGISIQPLEKIGFKGTSLSHMIFDDVNIPASDVLGGDDGLNKGEAQWEHVINTLLLEAASEAVGVARGAFDYALQYAKDRVQFDQPIGKFKSILHKFSQLSWEIEASRMLVYKAAWLADRGKPWSRSVTMAKCLACETARKASMEALQVLGGYGYTMEYDTQRYVRDAVMLTNSVSTTDSLKEKLGSGLGL